MSPTEGEGRKIEDGAKEAFMKAKQADAIVQIKETMKTSKTHVIFGASGMNCGPSWGMYGELLKEHQGDNPNLVLGLVLGHKADHLYLQ